MPRLPGLDAGMDAAKSLISGLRALSNNDISEAEVLDAYARSHTIFTCANIRADNVASVPLRVVDKEGNPLTAHPLSPIFDPTSNIKDVMRRSEVTLSLTGSNLIVPQPNPFGYYQRYGDNLRWLNPQLWQKRVDANGNLEGFRISRSSRFQHTDETFIPAYQAIYQYGIDLSDDYEGVAPGEVAFRAGVSQDEKWQTVYSYFFNRAIPGAILQPAAENKSFSANKETPNMLRRLLENMFSGSKNAGRTLVSPERLEHIAIQTEMDKLALPELSSDARQAICEAMQVPTVLLDFAIADYKADNAVKFWYQFWLKPRLEWYADSFSQFFTRWTGQEVIIAPDFGDIFQEDDQTDVINEQVRGGYRSYHSAAVAVGENAPDELMNLYHVEGIGPVPLSELRNVWRIKLNMDAQNSGLVTPSTPLSEVANTPALPATTETDSAPNNIIAIPAASEVVSVYVPDDIYKEIAVATRKGDAFVADRLDEYTTAYIKSLVPYVEDRNEIIDAAKAVYLSIQSAKAIQATRLNYEVAFEDILSAAIAGNIDRRRFSTLLRAEVARYIRLAYIDGLTDGGVADAQLSDEDNATIKSMTAEQSQYISSIGETLYKGDGISEKEAAGKPEMWWNKSIYPAYIAGLQSAAGNGYFEWVMDARKENCDTCIALNGQVHRLNDYVSTGWLPKASKLDCGGHRCGCGLAPRPKGKERGNFPSGAKSEHDHTHEHQHEPVEVTA